MTDKQIIIDGVNVSGCTYSKIGIDKKIYCEQDLYDDGTPVFTCDECTNCYFKQLKRKEQKLKQITNMLFTGQCSNCEGYSPNCSNKELCNFKHNIKNIIDEVNNAR